MPTLSAWLPQSQRNPAAIEKSRLFELRLEGKQLLALELQLLHSSQPASALCIAGYVPELRGHNQIALLDRYARGHVLTKWIAPTPVNAASRNFRLILTAGS